MTETKTHPLLFLGVQLFHRWHGDKKATALTTSAKDDSPFTHTNNCQQAMIVTCMARLQLFV